jgi:GGDEF domain-containing protein
VRCPEGDGRPACEPPRRTAAALSKINQVKYYGCRIGGRSGADSDRLYRVGGDEFGAVLVDCTEEESFGLMKRVATALKSSPVRWVSLEGKAVEFNITTSIGVAECSEPSKIKTASGG